jgi:hypothetical protein
VRADCTGRASSGPSRSTRGAFHQQVLPAAACAGQETRHRFPGTNAAGPASGATPSSLARRRLSLLGFAGLITLLPISTERRLSISAITAVLQHSCGQTVHPAYRQKSCLLWPVMRAALHLSVQDRPSCLVSGAAEGSRHSPAPPRAITRRGASPRSNRLGHLLSRSRACAGRRIPAQEKEQVPANPPPDGAQGAVRLKGRSASVQPRRGTQAAYPRCLPSTDSPAG